jgi:hypothetical protein
MTDARAGREDTLYDLAALLRAFAQARDWERYHTPKNLAMALAGETGELVACFQWLTPTSPSTSWTIPVSPKPSNPN